LLTACASAPPKTNAQLDRARAEVQTLERDPAAQQSASRELEAARAELQQAETALEKREPQEQVTHLAYLATRHAEIGQSRLIEARARQEVSEGEAERNRVLLEARTREAQAAKSAAQSAQSAAQSARSEALSMAQQLAALQAQQTQRGMVVT